MKSVYDVIKGPLFTEKGTAMKEAENKVLISVDIYANKLEIKQAVEEIFKVKIERIATISVRAKDRAYGKYRGKTARSKKAIITLKPGQKLEFIEGA